MTTEDLKLAQKNIKSISSTLEKRIKEIKEAVKDMDLKPASNPENKSVNATPTTGYAQVATSVSSAIGLSLAAILKGY